MFFSPRPAPWLGAGQHSCTPLPAPRGAAAAAWTGEQAHCGILDPVLAAINGRRLRSLATSR